MRPILLILSTVIGLLAPITYIVSIINGETRPHRVTRFVLTIVAALNLASIMGANGNPGALLIAGLFLAQSLALLILSIWRGIGGTTAFDLACLGIAIVGIIGWKSTGNPIIGLSFAILADFAAYLPAFLKTWKMPRTESPWFYIAALISSAFSLMAYDIGYVSAFQIYVIISCLIMLMCIYHVQLYSLVTKGLNRVQI